MIRKIARIAQKSMRRLGYEVVPTTSTLLRSRPLVDSWPAAPASIRRIRPYSMLSKTRLEAIIDQVAYCERNSIAGAFVECGVWRGGAIALMCASNLWYGTARRPVHLFDSFEGIPEPDAAIDGQRAVEEACRFGTGTRGRLVANPQFYQQMGRSYGPLEDSQHVISRIVGYPEQWVHYHKGFFENEIPRVAPTLDSIAFLRLDGDWYSSTKVCLEHLYAVVSPGGIVSIDDYGAYDGCRRAVHEFFESIGESPYLHPIDRENVFLIKASRHDLPLVDTRLSEAACR